MSVDSRVFLRIRVVIGHVGDWDVNFYCFGLGAELGAEIVTAVGFTWCNLVGFFSPLWRTVVSIYSGVWYPSVQLFPFGWILTKLIFPRAPPFFGHFPNFTNSFSPRAQHALAPQWRIDPSLRLKISFSSFIDPQIYKNIWGIIFKKTILTRIKFKRSRSYIH